MESESVKMEQEEAQAQALPEEAGAAGPAPRPTPPPPPAEDADADLEADEDEDDDDYDDEDEAENENRVRMPEAFERKRELLRHLFQAQHCWQASMYLENHSLWAKQFTAGVARFQNLGNESREQYRRLGGNEEEMEEFLAQADID